jgi:hypothetical protein
MFSPKRYNPESQLSAEGEQKQKKWHWKKKPPFE